MLLFFSYLLPAFLVLELIVLVDFACLNNGVVVLVTDWVVDFVSIWRQAVTECGTSLFFWPIPFRSYFALLHGTPPCDSDISFASSHHGREGGRCVSAYLSLTRWQMPGDMHSLVSVRASVTCQLLWLGASMRHLLRLDVTWKEAVLEQYSSSSKSHIWSKENRITPSKWWLIVFPATAYWAQRRMNMFLTNKISFQSAKALNRVASWLLCDCMRENYWNGNTWWMQVTAPQFPNFEI